MPPGACDCHAHVCGPTDRYPLFEKRIYSPADSSIGDYRHMLRALGVERAVLVQPSFYSTDNSAMLDAMKVGGSGFRAIAVVPSDVSNRELEELNTAGVRGVRVNIVDVKESKGVLPIDYLRSIGKRIRPFGWSLELLMHVDEFPDLDRAFAHFPVDIVLGHLGYVRADKGVATAGFQALLRLMNDGKAWAKLTGPYRISLQPLPHRDTNPYAHALIDAAPGRTLWGTDWPHVMAKWTIPMPNDGELADLLADWIPDSALRKRVLVDNPAALYGFTP